MAVKQNPQDQQEQEITAAEVAAAAAAAAAAASAANSAVGGGPANSTDEGGGGCGAGGVDVANELNGDADSKTESAAGTGKSSCSTERQLHDINGLLSIMQAINPDDQPATLMIYQHVIFNLARMQLSTQPEDLKRFKEEITKVGQFLALPNKKRYLMFYLRIVYQLITQASYEPSCAVAIVFQLFSPNLVIEAVQLLLDLNVQDDSIRKTVGLLCKWISSCNFCQNLNLWIMALLQGLREQEKYLLLDEIALDNIESLFILMIFPALRLKVAPIVFHMLSTINQSPEIFYKVRDLP